VTDETKQDTALGWIARWLSAIGSPYLVGPAMMGALLYAVPGTAMQKVLWASLCIVLPMSGPFLFTVWMMRRGLISDLHIGVREHRKQVFMVAAVFAGLAYLALWAADAPHLLLAMGRVYLIGCGSMGYVTQRWKISIHASFMGAATVIAYRAFGDQVALWMAVGSVLVLWSRTYRGRHTPAQVLAGVILGALLTWTVTMLPEPTGLFTLVQRVCNRTPG
jgi:membrane-associated phospholipid phosphatase